MAKITKLTGREGLNLFPVTVPQAVIDPTSKKTLRQELDEISSSSGSGVTGVKGSSETSYRTGEVNITPDNLGITVVNNTADANKSVKHADTADIATKVGSSTVGSTTAPIYLSSGTPKKGSTYAGGTRITLNGTDKGGSTASIYAPTTYGTSGYVLKSEGSGVAPVWEVNNLKFTDVSASSWVEDTTYSEFPYRCDIECSGVLATDYATVVFGLAEAVSGKYAPICETKSGYVSIWSQSNEAITIPTIIITR